MRAAGLVWALLVAVAPVQAGPIHADVLQLIEKWLDAQRAYDRVPGLSAAIVQDEDLLWSGASGFADTGAQQRAKSDTIYGICSISKLFTGIAVMQLRDAGKLDIHDPVQKYLPWFNVQQDHPDSPPITVAALLTHSSGIPRESDYPSWMGPDFKFPTPEQVRARLGSQRTIYPADRYFQYSNLGLTLAGEIVARVSGEDYETYVRSHILQPLQLDDTETGFPNANKPARIATGYGYPGRDGDRPELPRYDARGITPAAGFSSTAIDLAKFASWQFRLLNQGDNAVLKANTLREMQRVQWLDPDWQAARGLAFGVYRVGDRILVGHSGNCPGFNTRLYLDTQTRYAVAVLANANGVNVDGYAAEVFDLLQAGAGDSDEQAPEADLSAYVGSYDLRPWGGEDLVFAWKGGLATLSLPTADPSAEIVQLERQQGDVFRTVRKDGNPGHEVRFQRDRDGNVSHMVYFSLHLPRLVLDKPGAN